MSRVQMSIWPATGIRRWRPRLSAGMVAVVLAWPGAALPYALDDLLRLPLDSLLQLRIRPSRAAPHGAADHSTSPRSREGRSHHGF